MVHGNTGVVRAPVEKAGFRPQANTLFQYYNADSLTAPPMIINNGHVSIMFETPTGLN